jgi:hypothetical protein
MSALTSRNVLRGVGLAALAGVGFVIGSAVARLSRDIIAAKRLRSQALRQETDELEGLAERAVFGGDQQAMRDLVRLLTLSDFLGSEDDTQPMPAMTPQMLEALDTIGKPRSHSPITSWGVGDSAEPAPDIAP